MTESKPKKWLRVKDMEEWYDVSRYTIHDWEKQGKIPPADRSLGTPRWSSLDVAEWDRRRLQEAKDAAAKRIAETQSLVLRDAGTLRATTGANS